MARGFASTFAFAAKASALAQCAAYIAEEVDACAFAEAAVARAEALHAQLAALAAALEAIRFIDLTVSRCGTASRLGVRALFAGALTVEAGASAVAVKAFRHSCAIAGPAFPGSAA